MWFRLNFPTDVEAEAARARGMLTHEEHKAVAAAASHRPSKYMGVSWRNNPKIGGRWVANIRDPHQKKQISIGYFKDEAEAARAWDKAARGLRGKDAHGGCSFEGRTSPRFPDGRITRWHRVNFPTKEEAARAKARGMPPPPIDSHPRRRGGPKAKTRRA